MKQDGRHLDPHPHFRAGLQRCLDLVGNASQSGVHDDGPVARRKPLPNQLTDRRPMRRR